MIVSYVAYDRDGRKQEGRLESPTLEVARSKLEGKGLFISRLVEGASAAEPASSSGDSRPVLWQPDLKRVALFTRELTVLVGTGVPVADAMRAIERQSKPEAWRVVVAQIRGALESGASLSEALTDQSKRFDPVYRSLVAAGEESGDLGGMLGRLAELVRRQVAVRASILGAMIYPLTLSLLSLSAMIVILLVVVPRFSGMFAALNAPLPASTELLIGMSGALRAYWWAGLTALAVVVPALVWYVGTPRGRELVDRAMVTVPIFSPIVRGATEARLARVLSTLLEAHVPLLESMSLVTASMTNGVYRRMLERAQESVSQGAGLAPVLEDEGLIRPAFVEAVRSGEATGRLGEVLGNLAGHIEGDNDAALRMLSKTIEPVIIASMGVAVAFLALSMFLPLFDISAQAGGGVR